MNKRDIIVKELEQMPEPILEEVISFIRVIKDKQKREKLSISILSESSLAKDWLRPEEDEAWKEL